MLRVVMDTNLFVSSLLSKSGVPARAVRAWRERQYLLVISPTLIKEIQHTLNYDHLRDKYHFTDQDIADLILLLEQEALLVPGKADVWGAVPDDPDDDHIIACAVDGQADVIISGDRHLLSLAQYGGIPILTVQDFLSRLED